MAEITFSLQLVIAIVLLASASLKLVEIRQFHEALVEAGYTGKLAKVAKWAVPVSEIVVAVLLLSPWPYSMIGAAASVVMFVAFAWYIRYALRSGQSCHCFGALSTSRATWITALRNGAFLASAIVLVWRLRNEPDDSGGGVVTLALEAYNRQDSDAQLLALVTLVTIALLWVLMIATITRLSQVSTVEPSEYRTASPLSTPDAEHMDIPRPFGKQIGSTVADVPMMSGDEKGTSLSRVVRDVGGSAVIVFTDPSCSACRALDGLLPGWLGGTSPRNVIIVTRRPSEQMGGLTELERVNGRIFYQNGFEVARALGAFATPSAVGVTMSDTGDVIVSTETVVSAAKVGELVDAIGKRGGYTEDDSYKTVTVQP